jgi:hypothetical protein
LALTGCSHLQYVDAPTFRFLAQVHADLHLNVTLDGFWLVLGSFPIK